MPSRARWHDTHLLPDHFSVACFLINDMGRFPRFKGRDLNSASQIIDLLKARTHPSYLHGSASIPPVGE